MPLNYLNSILLHAVKVSCRTLLLCLSRYLASSEANSNPDSCVVAALSALAAASTPQRGYPASSVSTLATKIVQPLSGQYPPSSPTTPSNLSENLGHLPSSSAIPSNLGPQPSSSAILTSGLIQLRPLLSSASAMTSNQRMGRSLSFNGYSDPHIGSHSASGSIAVQECEISSPREARQCQGPSQTLLDESKGIHISRAMPFMDVPFQIDQTRAIIDTCMTDSTRASIIPTMHLGDIPKVTYRGITAADNGLVHFSALRPPEGFHETAEDMIATARNGGSKILKKRPASGMSFTTDVNFLRHDAEKRCEERIQYSIIRSCRSNIATQIYVVSAPEYRIQDSKIFLPTLVLPPSYAWAGHTIRGLIRYNSVHLNICTAM